MKIILGIFLLWLCLASGLKAVGEMEWKEAIKISTAIFAWVAIFVTGIFLVFGLF